MLSDIITSNKSFIDGFLLPFPLCHSIYYNTHNNNHNTINCLITSPFRIYFLSSLTIGHTNINNSTPRKITRSTFSSEPKSLNPSSSHLTSPTIDRRPTAPDNDVTTVRVFKSHHQRTPRSVRNLVQHYTPLSNPPLPWLSLKSI